MGNVSLLDIYEINNKCNKIIDVSIIPGGYMSDSEIKASIPGMREGYSEYAISQRNAVINGLEKAINRLIKNYEPNTAFSSNLHLVDLGAADGINSFPVIDKISHELMKKQTPLNLLVSHIDLPTSYFNDLIHNIFEHVKSYRNTVIGESINIYSAITPGSFYNSFLPESSVDILFSTTALHYASKRASILRKHVHPLFATSEEKKLWDLLRENDLNTALTNIHSSLKPGGKFWAVAPGCYHDESTGRIKNYWYREVLDVMSERLQILVEKNIVDEEKWNNFVLPVHQHSLEQWQKWFDENESMFKLEFLYGEEHVNPYLQRFHNEHHNSERFADEYLLSIRAWGEKIIAQMLPDPDKRDVFFEGLRYRFIEEPERFENDSYSVYIGATRL